MILIPSRGVQGAMAMEEPLPEGPLIGLLRREAFLAVAIGLAVDDLMGSSGESEAEEELCGNGPLIPFHLPVFFFFFLV